MNKYLKILIGLMVIVTVMGVMNAVSAENICGVNIIIPSGYHIDPSTYETEYDRGELITSEICRNDAGSVFGVVVFSPQIKFDANKTIGGKNGQLRYNPSDNLYQFMYDDGGKTIILSTDNENAIYEALGDTK